MKKIIYTLVFFGFTFLACSPLDDVYSEIDGGKSDKDEIVGIEDITLTDADYKSFEKKYGNFDSNDEAKLLLPDFLKKKYSFWGKGSSVAVTYNLYSKKNTEKSLKVREVIASDYGAAGLNYPNISNDGQIQQLLKHLYPSPENRVLVSLTYVERNSGVNSAVENGFIFANDSWEKSMGISSTEYTSMGESRAQFSNKDEALVKIPLFLKTKLQYNAPETGQIEGVMYKLYTTDKQDIDSDGRVDDKAVYSFVDFFIYNGIDWLKYNNNIEQTIKFGHNGKRWVPDNTINYALTHADYELVGNGKYNNFNLKKGEDEEKEEVRVEKINTILLANFPNAKEGQKYVVSYKYYDGSKGIKIIKVVKKGSIYILLTE